MADITPRMSAAEYLARVSGGGSAASPGAGAGRPRRRAGLGAKYGNRKVELPNGEKFDSGKELRHMQLLEACRCASDAAQRVTHIERQKRFLLIEKQDGERAVSYHADFVVRYADGREEVHDVKSAATRTDKTYVLKRKLMLSVHGIRIQEF
jgi:hypothetical protein